MRRSRVPFHLLACLAAALIFSSLGPAPAVRAAVLRIGMSADVTAIDPHLVNIAPNNAVAWHLYDALALVDADTRLVPGLATAWRTIDDRTWEFTLRKGVRFHDGSEFTAEDVAFSIERARTLGDKGGQFAGFTRAIVETRVVDSHTIRFRTASPYAVLAQDLHSIFIVSRKAAAGASSEAFASGKAAIGTGPYRLASFARGERIELVRNDAYWGPKPAWERVTLRLLTQDTARLAALIAGDVDAIENIPTPDLARVKRDARLRIEQKVSWRTIFFHLDQAGDNPPGVTDRAGKPLGKNPFKDVRVREAIARAINRPALVERVMEAMALPAANLVAPPVFGHNATLKPVPYDPEGARRLLASAGYPDGFTITLAAPNNRYVNDDQIAQAAAQMLARVGIAVARVETHPAATYFTKARNGEFAFAMLGWGSFGGDLALRTLLGTPSSEKGYGAWNWGRYSNPTVDRLIGEALASVDQAKREALARDAMATAMREHAVIALHHQIASWAMKRELAYAARTDEYTLAQFFSAR